MVFALISTKERPLIALGMNAHPDCGTIADQTDMAVHGLSKII